MIQQENSPAIFAIIGKLVELSKAHPWKYGDIQGQSNPIIITGGETAVLDTIKGFEVGLNATGYVRKGHEIPPNAKPGDLLIGLGSSGVHSNGLTFLRHEMFGKRKMTLDYILPWGASVGEELTIPTEVYLKGISSMIDGVESYLREPANKKIHGMVHITGGGLSKLKELVPGRDLDIEVRRCHNHRLEPQPIFIYTYGILGVSSENMYKRFNNGIGYVIAVDPSIHKEVLALLSPRFRADVIGEVKKGTGKISIESAYEPITVEYQA